MLEVVTGRYHQGGSFTRACGLNVNEKKDRLRPSAVTGRTQAHVISRPTVRVLTTDTDRGGPVVWLNLQPRLWQSPRFNIVGAAIQSVKQLELSQLCLCKCDALDKFTPGLSLILRFPSLCQRLGTGIKPARNAIGHAGTLLHGVSVAVAADGEM
jgi:hypothetical protein